MSAVVTDPPRTPRVRLLGDARPPAVTWARGAAPTPLDQPALTFTTETDLLAGPPRPRGHRLRVVAAPFPEARPPGLPDAESWSASLALALAEALQGRRPVGQLARWVDDGALARLTVAIRRRRSTSAPSPRLMPPARLRSVHLQFPQPSAVEASAHVQVARQSSAFAFRLDAWHDRWLCTALELGPRDREL